MSPKSKINFQFNWFHSSWLDGLFILFPPFFTVSLVVLFPEVFQNPDFFPTEAWLVLIVFVDVAHVYSTLYRTYLEKETFNKLKIWMISIPIVGWGIGVALFNISPLLFWRILAYLAVFHFVRQQYGFFRIYAKNDDNFGLIDKIAIYSATIYPILFWHINSDRKFNWFVENDFIQSNLIEFNSFLLAIYLFVILVYLAKEIYQSIKFATIQIIKNVVLLGTAISWYFGIVYFNADLAFTTINVVSHGIPYLALVWIFINKTNNLDSKVIGLNPKISTIDKIIGHKFGVLFFIGSVLLLAYFEESIWDSLVWKEHQNVFGFIKNIYQINFENLNYIIVPLLTVPQFTHYILDGFIWKNNK